MGYAKFYGLRKVDLNSLEGRCGILCFLWDGQPEPLFVPFSEFEDVFTELSPANDAAADQRRSAARSLRFLTAGSRNSRARP